MSAPESPHGLVLPADSPLVQFEITDKSRDVCGDVVWVDPVALLPPHLMEPDEKHPARCRGFRVAIHPKNWGDGNFGVCLCIGRFIE